MAVDKDGNILTTSEVHYSSLDNELNKKIGLNYWEWAQYDMEWMITHPMTSKSETRYD